MKREDTEKDEHRDTEVHRGRFYVGIAQDKGKNKKGITFHTFLFSVVLCVRCVSVFVFLLALCCAEVSHSSYPLHDARPKLTFSAASPTFDHPPFAFIRRAPL
jgi:hypothetical protein